MGGWWAVTVRMGVLGWECCVRRALRVVTGRDGYEVIYLVAMVGCVGKKKDH